MTAYRFSNSVNLDWFEKRKILSSIHEAGHAVAAWFIGARIKEVSVSLNFDRGRCLWHHNGFNYLDHDSTGNGEVQDALLATLAGIAAQTRKAIELGEIGACWDTDSAREDLVLAASRLALIDPSAGILHLSPVDFYYKFRDQSRSFIDKTPVWACIEALAAALRERKALTGREAVSVILEAWGDRPLPPKSKPLEAHNDGAEKEDKR